MMQVVDKRMKKHKVQIFYYNGGENAQEGNFVDDIFKKTNRSLLQ